MINKIEKATVNDLKNGFIYNANSKIFTCLFCNERYEEGDVYSFGNRLVSAEKAIKLHISEKHGFVFNNLLSSDDAQTGLTTTQKDFLKNYYSGISDKEIAEKMNITPSTVRHQRYTFREKAKQAKMIIALYELLEEKENEKDIVMKTSNQSDEKHETFFVSISPLVLKTFNVKEKNKLFILKTILKQFDKGKKYTEKEVNYILKQIYSDHIAIRRSLIDYGLMKRTDDGKEYWMK